MISVDEGYEALRNSVGAVEFGRDAISVDGPEALSYLQGQLSQDVEALVVGASSLSFILQPHGKVDSLVRVTRRDAEAFVLDTDAGFGEALLARMERFKMRTKVDIAPLSNWKMVALRGATATALAHVVSEVQGVEMVTESHWRGIEGLDLFGESVVLPTGLPQASAEAYSALRIECGIPTMGAELDEKTIPAEAAVNDLAINFRKGCYTGQELVARIDARGNNVPRHLVGVVIESSEAPPRGARLIAAGRMTNTKPWGVLTSSAWSPGFKAGVALAYVRREVQTPSDALLEWDEGPTPCRILPLPMVPASVV